MEDVRRNIDLSKPKHNDDMAIIVLQSLEVRIYLGPFSLCIIFL